MVSGFWHKHPTKISVFLFILLSAVILLLDLEAIEVLGFTFEEEIFFPAIGILFLVIGLFVLKKKITGKSEIFSEWRKMKPLSKLFGLLSLLLVLATFFLAIFKDLSLFSLNSLIITEEEAISIGMLLSILLFIYFHSREVLAEE